MDAQLDFRVTAKNTVQETVAEEDKWVTKIHQFLSMRLPPKELNRYKASPFIYCRTPCTTRELMTYDIAQFGATKRTQSYGKPIAEWQEDTMPEML